MSTSNNKHSQSDLLPQFDDRTIDLLTTRAIDGLSIAEQTELRALLHKAGVEDDFSFELAAASLELSCFSPEDVAPLPPEIAKSLSMVGQTWSQQARSSVTSVPAAPIRSVTPIVGPSSAGFDRARDTFSVTKPSTTPHTHTLPQSVAGSTAKTSSSRLPWALAAVMSVVAIASFSRLNSIPAGTNSSSGTSTSPTIIATDSQPDLSAQLSQVRQVIAQAPDTSTLEWKDWDNPEIPGVKGTVSWSEQKQTGVIKFVGLKPNDPTKMQYQLWIIDSRGMNQRVSGAIFNAGPDGCAEVPILPRIAIKNAAAFAITIEEPGGTWVSDMKRRVVIAAKG